MMFGIHKALYFRIDIDISKLLQHGIDVVVVNTDMRICLMFVKLCDFYDVSRYLRHVLNGHDMAKAKEDDLNLQF